MALNRIISRIGLVIILVIGILSPSFAQVNFERYTLKIKRQNDSAASFNVEIARSPKQRAQGLMHRQELSDDAGMLFIWPGVGLRQFWMKDTFISLDILFFDENGVLVHHEDHTKPNSTNLISSLMPVAYVLEIKAGQREANGLEIGDYLIPSPSWQK